MSTTTTTPETEATAKVRYQVLHEFAVYYGNGLTWAQAATNLATEFGDDVFGIDFAKVSAFVMTEYGFQRADTNDKPADAIEAWDGFIYERKTAAWDTITTLLNTNPKFRNKNVIRLDEVEDLIYNHGG